VTAVDAAARHRRARVVGIVLAVLYAVVLLGILFWPEHVDGPGGQRAQWLVDLVAALGIEPRTAYLLIESAANVALFVPAGVILALLAGGRFRWWMPVLGIVGSAAVELAQGALLPGRTADWRDIAADSAGVVIGAAVVAVVVRIRRRSRPSTAAR
jgi:glycopeptide antibiotics resistance protein